MNDNKKKYFFTFKRFLYFYVQTLVFSKGKTKDFKNVLEEEAITSPSKVVWKNFLHDKLARLVCWVLF